jgi:hypothetical protein
MSVNDKYSIKRQHLDIGQRILQDKFPESQIEIKAGKGEPDFVIHGSKEIYVDQKWRDELHDDIAIEYASVNDDGSSSLGWLLTHPEWHILYVMPGVYYYWKTKDILWALKAGRLPLTDSIPSRKGNSDYTTLSFGIKPEILGAIVEKGEWV